MKYILILTVFLSIAKAEEFATTENATSKSKANETQNASDYSFGVALNMSSFLYQEPHMKQSGNMNGFDLLAKYKVNPSFSVSGNLNYLSGVLEYDGRMMSGTPAKDQDKYTVYDIITNGEILTDLTETAQTSFLIGVGRRVTLDANDPSPYDYQRQHLYNYYLLGVQIAIPHNPTSTTTIQVGNETLISGNVKTQLSDVDKSYPDLDQSFNSGSALSAGVSHSHQFSFGTVYGSVNYKRWQLSESAASTVLINGKAYTMVEPANSTTVISLDAGMLF